MSWTFPRAEKQYGAYARVPLCKACGGPFVPPGYDGCCSERCIKYLAIAGQPVLGDPIFCQRDEPIMCRGCEMSFISRGIRLCPECYFRARPAPHEGCLALGSSGCETATCDRETPAKPLESHNLRFEDRVISDRDPRSRCHW